MKKTFKAKMFAKFFVFGIIFLVVFSFAVMLLWNNILVNVLHVGTINVWQALGLFVLAKILFGGFHGGRWGRHQYWRKGMQQRWMNMTPEEREKFKQNWKDRCRGRFEDTGPLEEQTEPNK